MVDRASAFLLLSVLVLIVILLVFGMKYFSLSRAKLVGQGRHEDNEARAVKTEEEIATALASIRSGVGDLQSRLARIESILKEVE